MEEDQLDALNTAKLVNLYMTPLALFIVALGVIASFSWNRITVMSLTLVAITALANLTFVYLAGKIPDKVLLIRRWRMGFNYAANAALVFLLLPIMAPIWLLFLLNV